MPGVHDGESTGRRTASPIRSGVYLLGTASLDRCIVQRFKARLLDIKRRGLSLCVHFSSQFSKSKLKTTIRLSMSQMPPNNARMGRTSDFMKYPYPETERILTHLESLPGVTAETKGYVASLSTLPQETDVDRCIANLLQYRAVRTRARLPRGQSAAVLVPLFVGRSGDLYVLLSRCVHVLCVCYVCFRADGVGGGCNRRSEALKAFSGDTALPGGKIDAQDVTVEDTAVSFA